MYSLFVPNQAVGANLVYFDFWVPSTAGAFVEAHVVEPIVSGAVAVTGVVAVDLFLTRTTAIGTGGTAATAEGTSLTAATFSHWGGSQPMNLNRISARLTPTGGATAGAVLSHGSYFSEETNAGTYTPRKLNCAPFVIMPGSGFRVVQGGVASVGNVGFNVLFKWVNK